MAGDGGVQSGPVEVAHIGGWVVVRFHTERLTDFATIARISERLHADLANLPRGGKVLLNFRGVQHASSQIVGLIVSLKSMVDKVKGTFCLCRLEPPLKEVLRLTKLDKVVELRDSESETVGKEHYVQMRLEQEKKRESGIKWMG